MSEDRKGFAVPAAKAVNEALGFSPAAMAPSGKAREVRTGTFPDADRGFCANMKEQSRRHQLARYAGATG